MGAVDIVGRLPSFVGTVKQAAIFRVPQEQFGQLAAPPSDGNVERRVSLLRRKEEEMKSPQSSTTNTTFRHHPYKPEQYLVHCRHLGSFIQQQLHYFYVPHFRCLDERSFSLLKKTNAILIIAIVYVILPKRHIYPSSFAIQIRDCAGT